MRCDSCDLPQILTFAADLNNTKENVSDELKQGGANQYYSSIMGISLDIYEDLPLSQPPQRGYSRISERNMDRLREMFESRRGFDQQVRWRFETSGRLSIEDYNLQGMNHARSQDGSLWIFYLHTSLVVYNCNDERLVDCSHLISSPITCIDCHADTQYLWFAVGSAHGFQIVCCSREGTLVEKEQAVVVAGIVDISAFLLPHCAIIITRTEILIYDEELETLVSIPEDTKCKLEYPNVIMYNDTKLNCFNVITRSNEEMKPNLKAEESVVNVTTLSTGLLLIETNQRYLSLSPEQETIFHMTSPSRVTFKNRQLYVVEHHLYATSLTMYEYCVTARRWQLKNYYDLRTKFNIVSVDALIIVDKPTTSALTLLIDEFLVNFQ